MRLLTWNVRKHAALLWCVGSLLGMCAPPSLQAATAARAAAGSNGAAKEIFLVHPFDAEREVALKALVERFNDGSKDYRISVRKGTWSDDGSPQLMILQDREMERFLAGKARYKALAEVMREGGMPLQALKPPAMMARALLDAKGRLLALPVGLSTPVLYINRGEFRRVGLDPDAPLKTWFDLQQALGRLFDSGSTCPYTVAHPGRVMIENTSAWHNAPVSARQGKRERASFNGMLQVKHVAMMASWYRARYLRIFDGAQEAEHGFARGECAVIAAPSASWTDFRRTAGLDVGIAPLPYHDDFPGAPQNTLADGAALWVAAGQPRAEYKAIARFIGFWLQPENQLAWQRASGYLPLNRAGMFAARGGPPDPDRANIDVAVSELNNKPATAESGASAITGRAEALDIVDEELRAVWADSKAAKEALDNAVARIDAARPTGR